MSGKHTVPSGITVIIPSYNPDERLLSTIFELLSAGANDILVVNDGSARDSLRTFSEIKKIPGCTVISHSTNRGKGAALKTGIAYCLDNRPGAKGVVTVDGDGHHRTCDIVSCAHKMLESGQVILGMRRPDDKTISKRGRYGNAITAGAIKIVCGYKVPDPMTGLRGIPRRYLSTFLQTKGDNYDFETNMILDFKRRGVPFRMFHIIGEYYSDGKKSHFRLVRDSVAIFAEIIKYFGQQFKYVLSSISSYLIEYIIYLLLLANLPGIGITLTNYICRIFSGAMNFVINRHLVFKSKENYGKTVIRYIIVAIFVMLMSTEIIVLINRIFTDRGNVVARYVKVPVDCAMFFVSYFLQKKWVFPDDKKNKK